MKANSIKISIIVPVYGVEKDLPKCIESLLNQTYTDIEIILVDDGSKDNCPQICDNYAKMDDRIHVIHKPNGGLVSARKAGAHFASGDYIINVDGDDYIEEHLVEKIHIFISKYAPDAIAYGYDMFDDKSNDVFYSAGSENEKFLDSDGINELRKGYLFNINIKGLNGGTLIYSICTKAVKREIYVKCQNIVPDYITNGEDTLFTMKLLMECKSLYMTKIKGYMYRCRCKSMINSVTKDDFRILGQLLDEFKKVQGSSKEMNNQIAAYIMVRINALSTNAVKSGLSYKDFAKYIAACIVLLKTDPVRYGVQLKQGSYKDWFLVFLIRHRMWLLLFYYKRSKYGYQKE